MSRSAHFHISLAACRQVAGNEEWMTPRECWRLFGNSSRRRQECEAFAEENCSKLEAKVEGTLAPESFRIAIVFFLRLLLRHPDIKCGYEPSILPACSDPGADI